MHSYTHMYICPLHFFPCETPHISCQLIDHVLSYPYHSLNNLQFPILLLILHKQLHLPYHPLNSLEHPPNSSHPSNPSYIPHHIPMTPTSSVPYGHSYTSSHSLPSFLTPSHSLHFLHISKWDPVTQGHVSFLSSHKT